MTVRFEWMVSVMPSAMTIQVSIANKTWSKNEWGWICVKNNDVSLIK